MDETLSIGSPELLPLGDGDVDASSLLPGFAGLVRPPGAPPPSVELSNLPSQAGEPPDCSSSFLGGGPFSQSYSEWGAGGPSQSLPAASQLASQGASCSLSCLPLASPPASQSLVFPASLEAPHSVGSRPPRDPTPADVGKGIFLCERIVLEYSGDFQLPAEVRLALKHPHGYRVKGALRAGAGVASSQASELNGEALKGGKGSSGLRGAALETRGREDSPGRPPPVDGAPMGAPSCKCSDCGRCRALAEARSILSPFGLHLRLGRELTDEGPSRRLPSSRSSSTRRRGPAGNLKGAEAAAGASLPLALACVPSASDSSSPSPEGFTAHGGCICALLPADGGREATSRVAGQLVCETLSPKEQAAVDAAAALKRALTYFLLEAPPPAAAALARVGSLRVSAPKDARGAALLQQHGAAVGPLAAVKLLPQQQSQPRHHDSLSQPSTNNNSSSSNGLSSNSSSASWSEELRGKDSQGVLVAGLLDAIMQLHDVPSQEHQAAVCSNHFAGLLANHRVVLTAASKTFQSFLLQHEEAVKAEFPRGATAARHQQQEARQHRARSFLKLLKAFVSLYAQVGGPKAISPGGPSTYTSFVAAAAAHNSAEAKAFYRMGKRAHGAPLQVFLLLSNFRVRGARVTDGRVSFTDAAVSHENGLEVGPPSTTKAFLLAFPGRGQFQVYGGALHALRASSFNVLRTLIPDVIWGLAKSKQHEAQQLQAQRAAAKEAAAAAAAAGRPQQQPLLALTDAAATNGVEMPQDASLFYCWLAELREQLPLPLRRRCVLERKALQCLKAAKEERFARPLDVAGVMKVTPPALSSGGLEEAPAVAPASSSMRLCVPFVSHRFAAGRKEASQLLPQQGPQSSCLYSIVCPLAALLPSVFVAQCVLLLLCLSALHSLLVLQMQLLLHAPPESLVSSVYFRFLAKYEAVPPLDADLAPPLRPSWLRALGALKPKPSGGPPSSSDGGAPVAAAAEAKGPLKNLQKEEALICLVTGEAEEASVFGKDGLVASLASVLRLGLEETALSQRECSCLSVNTALSTIRRLCKNGGASLETIRRVSPPGTSSSLQSQAHDGAPSSFGGPLKVFAVILVDPQQSRAAACELKSLLLLQRDKALSRKVELHLVTPRWAFRYIHEGLQHSDAFLREHLQIEGLPPCCLPGQHSSESTTATTGGAEDGLLVPVEEPPIPQTLRLVETPQKRLGDSSWGLPLFGWCLLVTEADFASLPISVAELNEVWGVSVVFVSALTPLAILKGLLSFFSSKGLDVSAAPADMRHLPVCAAALTTSTELHTQAAVNEALGIYSSSGPPSSPSPISSKKATAKEGPASSPHRKGPLVMSPRRPLFFPRGSATSLTPLRSNSKRCIRSSPIHGSSPSTSRAQCAASQTAALPSPALLQLTSPFSLPRRSGGGALASEENPEALLSTPKKRAPSASSISNPGASQQQVTPLRSAGRQGPCTPTRTRGPVTAEGNKCPSSPSAKGSASASPLRGRGPFSPLRGLRTASPLLRGLNQSSVRGAGTPLGTRANLALYHRGLWSGASSWASRGEASQFCAKSSSYKMSLGRLKVFVPGFEGIPLVRSPWLLECMRTKRLLNMRPFLWVAKQQTDGDQQQQQQQQQPQQQQQQQQQQQLGFPLSAGVTTESLLMGSSKRFADGEEQRTPKRRKHNAASPPPPSDKSAAIDVIGEAPQSAEPQHCAATAGSLGDLSPSRLPRAPQINTRTAATTATSAAPAATSPSNRRAHSRGGPLGSPHEVGSPSLIPRLSGTPVGGKATGHANFSSKGPPTPPENLRRRGAPPKESREEQKEKQGQPPRKGRSRATAPKKAAPVKQAKGKTKN
ncbi:hypothetical protein Emed_001606 [Eimeria media]